jgi:cobalamin biosynthesis protein CobT
MELKYKIALEENSLEEKDLSDEAKVMIEQINGTLKGVNMLEKSGKEVSEKTYNKLKAMDNLVCKEIAEQMQGNEEEEEVEEEEDGDDKNNKPPMREAIKDEEEEEEEEEEEQEDIKATPTEIIAEPNDPKGFQIDKDLKVAYENGKKTITLEELKTISKTAYDVVFSTYDESGDNGLTTSSYSLIETDENVFTLTEK